ncbi:MAG: hypothetical protein LAT53_04560 [Idiomarina sp.]|nr:hypothetical protein [Idiomarina sp.]
MSDTTHIRYKIEIYQGNEVVITFAAPKSHSPQSVVLAAQREISRVPTATHAVIRGLSGKVVEIDSEDGWIKAHIAAIKLR